MFRRYCWSTSIIASFNQATALYTFIIFHFLLHQKISKNSLIFYFSYVHEEFVVIYHYEFDTG